MSMTEYASHDDLKRPSRRDTSCKVPTYCPYPSPTLNKPTFSLEAAFLSHANSLPLMMSCEMTTPPLPVSSKSFSLFNDEPSSNKENERDIPMPLASPPISPRCITLNDLKFEKLIGTGMYSKVYLVQSTKSKAYYALKVIPKQLVKKTKSEREIMSVIDHPFLVKLWNHFEDEQNIYLMMEFAAGGELFYHLREKGKFDEATARFYAAEVVMALEYLHSSNVAFRDLKLENLVLSSTGHIKLTDFGFAKCLDESGRAFTLCGTPEYLAPEIIRGTGYSYSVDWWALGVLLFEMISGYSPFYSASPMDIYKNILSGRIRFPAGLNPDAKDLLKGLLARDPKKRLGVVRNGVSNLRQHPFFKGVQWSTTTTPPIQPSLQHEGDTTYFQLDDDGAGKEEPGEEERREGKEKAAALAKFPDF